MRDLKSPQLLRLQLRPKVSSSFADDEMLRTYMYERHRVT